MPVRTNLQIEADRRTIATRRRLGSELRQTREDQGTTATAVARAAGIDRAHLSRIEAGDSAGSLDVLNRIAQALGADVSVRLYPGTGPRLRDHIQAAITEVLLQTASPRWRRNVEVAVRRPARGVIDVVLDDDDTIVAAEVHSEIRRLEEQIRWMREKAEAIPSSELFGLRAAEASRPISRLLVLRSTVATRDLATRFGEILGAAYPAATRDAHAALTGEADWPGPAILWAAVDRGTARLLERPPRGVRVGA
jgi:transcriptional regulator with XRE-family HTH domain